MSTWSARVEAWKKSGQTAAEFAADKPYKGSTLLWRSCQLRKKRDEPVNGRDTKPRASRKTPKKIALAEVVRRAPDERTSGRVMVEVVGARVSVSRGFDATLLREVVEALRGAP